MGNTMQGIMSSKIKHKELVSILAEMAKSNATALEELFDILRMGSEVNKGPEREW